MGDVLEGGRDLNFGEMSSFMDAPKYNVPQPHSILNVMSSFLDAHYEHQQGFCRAHQSVNGHFVHWQKEPDFLSKRRRPIIG